MRTVGLELNSRSILPRFSEGRSMESPTLWNGQMEYPPARTSHTSDWNGQMESLQMDNSPAEGFPYSRLEWTDGMSTNWQFPILQKVKPSMLLKWYWRRWQLPNPPTEYRRGPSKNWLKKLTALVCYIMPIYNKTKPGMCMWITNKLKMHLEQVPTFKKSIKNQKLKSTYKCSFICFYFNFFNAEIACWVWY